MSSSVTTSGTAPHLGPPKHSSSEDEGPDAFGQTGVRQYVGKVVAWCCLIGAILTSAMWYRSTFFQDHAHWQSKDQEIDIHSVDSRLIVAFAVIDEHMSNNVGWDYYGGYAREFDDHWRKSVWKVVGIEWRFQPLDNSAKAGFWLRVKWQFIVECLLAIPAIRIFYLLLRRWREARE